MIIDLHCHSTASDGALTPTQLLHRAQAMQVDVLAITDHDALAGYHQAKAHLEQHPQQRPRLLPGVEISTRWEQFEIHILGWEFDSTHPALTALLAAQQECRRARSQAISQRLLQHGVAPSTLDRLPDTGVLTRRHFAEVLLADGYVDKIQQAFDRYLGKGQCAYEPTVWCSVPAAVSAIHQAGGWAGLAHPLAYGLSNKWLRRLLTDFVAAGGDTLEVVSCQQSRDQRQFLTELAVTYGLSGSVGSDFHRPAPWRELGRNLALPDNLTPVWQHWQSLQ